MITQALNNQSKTITGAALIIAGATLLSRIIGLVRDRIFAHYFGAGAIMDAYYAAFKIPDLIYNLLIVGALTAGFIPVFTKLFQQHGEDKSLAWRMANNIFNIAGITLIILGGLGVIFSQHFAPLIAPGFSEENKMLVITFTRIMFFSPIFLGLSMTLGGILQSLRKFLLYSIAPIFYNVGIIIGAIVFVPIFGITGLAWGVVFGAAMHFALQFYGAWQSGYRWKWIFDLRDKEMVLIAKLMAPRTLGLAISQLNIVVVTVLASWLPLGSVAVYNYANNLQGVPIGIIGIPFALAVFPVLSSAAAKNDMQEFAKNLSATIRQILFLIIPVSIAIMLLRAQIVRVVLGTGAFDWEATIHTANALAFFAFGLFAQSLIPLLARAFYSLTDTQTPFIIGVISELISIIAALILMKPLGVAGLALACSIGATINAVILFIKLRQKIKIIEAEKILSSLYRILAAALVMGLVIQWLKYPLAKIFNLNYFLGIFGQGFVAGVMGLAIYGLICYLLKVPEFIHFKNSFEKRFLKSNNLPAEAMTDTKE
ncbi:MAG: murein biosynthesis integral membrane protein MurJ [Candidatus Magasanikbacteria bacterium CG10_big_fil_rev_8_21_14_0_10_36_32]|uniref:Probable lipid II flippase MurJ n=1 Tax=Candidatus Magasanikbacteria bacterium CG10_big_fil_rev_8_21_14_0_10_36_32 TaxID=1974646 RepID=A0A2M6W649_9BACT|nr:MAG: murein biosynthesis integral membrane protein MurJ [Candidatus Magasanikbacteria bacterium CG10_big_fil_rev_8_21_14_0_10_36_32]